MKTIVITGGAGYIGAHLARYLKSLDYNVIIIDKKQFPKKLQNYIIKENYYQIDLSESENLNKLTQILLSIQLDSIIIHLAGLKSVSESINNKTKFEQNNLGSTKNLISAMKNARLKLIIFSSSAAVYGNQKPEVSEIDICKPISNYGEIKLKEEKLIEKFAEENQNNFCIFRYFNVAGAYSSEFAETEGDNLIPKSLTASAKGFTLNVFGNDCNTVDGTCIRDYIHIDDLVRAHVYAIEKIGFCQLGIINLGNGKGYSVLEVVNELRKYLKLNIKFTDRRAGDPEILIAKITKAKEVLNWYPIEGIESIVKSLFESKPH